MDNIWKDLEEKAKRLLLDRDPETDMLLGYSLDELAGILEISVYTLRSAAYGRNGKEPKLYTFWQELQSKKSEGTTIRQVKYCTKKAVLQWIRNESLHKTGRKKRRLFL